MELVAHEELSTWQLRRQVKLAPPIVTPTGEHGFGTRLIAAQTLRQLQNAIQVRTGTAILAVLLCLALSVAHQIFGQNGFFAMGFVLRRVRLEVKTNRGVLTPRASELS